MDNNIFILPAHWACGLINGDTSGMDADDEDNMNRFIQEVTPEFGYCAGCSEESWFQHGHDANRNQGANVLEFYFIK
jgi:hypothetical protein